MLIIARNKNEREPCHGSTPVSNDKARSSDSSTYTNISGGAQVALGAQLRNRRYAFLERSRVLAPTHVSGHDVTALFATGRIC